MRLLKCALAVGILALVPTRADAWFGFLDYLSGPGPFYGQLYDVRLICFGDPLQVANDADTKLRAAISASIGPNLLSADNEWMQFQEAAEKASEGFPVVPAAQYDRLKKALTTLRTLIQPGAARPDPSAVKPVAEDAIEQGVAYVAALYHANVVALSPGVLLSLCQERSMRTFSLDLDTGFWQANSRTTFANDHSIRLITVMAGVSFRPVNDPKHAKYDYVDIGAAIGEYWFSSRGFDTFSGLVIQPVRIDVHGPTSWANDPSCAKKFAALLTFRFGYMVFPGGFDANAFAGTGDHAKPIGAEWTPSLAIFFNITPFLHHHNVLGTPKTTS